MTDSKEVMIYTTVISVRFAYICNIVFGDNLLITTSKEDFLLFPGVTINYSNEKLGNDSIWIVPHGLLQETGIREQQITCTDWKRMSVFFQTRGELPFDIFAASFYLLSRYEEYLPHEKDMYGRYAHQNSIAFKERFLQLPLINLWMQSFGQYINGRFPYVAFTPQNRVFSYLPTYDIDIAYSYRHQSVIKNIVLFFKAILSANFEAFSERSAVYSGTTKDPFDVYDWLDELHDKYNLSPLYFFLLAEKQRGEDKNISPHTRGMKQLIKRITARYMTGIHPSWQSGNDNRKLTKEISLLKKISGKDVTVSRQHYIRMQLPDTYHHLVKAGILEDHSMGYGGINGFRASYTLPYKWYDLSAELQTDLIIYPFCFMDTNSIFHQQEHAYEAAKELQDYFDIIRSVNGQMVTVFHNHFLTEQEEWKDWRNMYAGFLREA